VIVFDAQLAVIPAGRPIAVPMPVAPVVVWVMAVKGVCTHSVGADEAAEALCSGNTVIVPVALALPQLPVSGIV
jgi:hypothetical protein